MEARLADKELEISRLVQENKELMDRLFLKNDLPIAGQSLIPEKLTKPAVAHDGWLSPKRRLTSYIDSQTPLVAELSEEEMAHLRESVQ